MMNPKWRYPCTNCLVEVTCKKSCDKFNKFIKPIDKKMDKFQDFFERLDDMIADESLIQDILDWLGDHIIGPSLFYSVKYFYGINVHKIKETRFDSRFDSYIHEVKIE